MNSLDEQIVPTKRVVLIGLFIGLLLNLTGWVGNNIILGSMWDDLSTNLDPVAWRESIWSDVFSLAPDFVYGLAIAWMIVQLRDQFNSTFSISVKVGIFVSLIGGITTYFAIANSGFVPWDLAIASFVLVLACKVPLSILAGHLLIHESQRKNT
ncbi:MAG: hypothetical protein GKR91_20710 [Pseudomonadales bacterium]|nr:hypothetical protein [Pseudomonadales bacterium]